MNERLNVAFWNGRTVCVTGGTGFLGRHIVQQLLAVGARPRRLSLPADAAAGEADGIPTVVGDVRDPLAVARAVRGCSVIFHTAGPVSVWGPAIAEMQAAHVEGTRTVLELVSPNARVVHTSSIVAVGAALDGHPCTEETAFNLADCRIPYVLAKKAAEDLALRAAEAGQWVTVVNPGYLVGPQDHGSVMGRLSVRAWKGCVPVALSGGYCLADVRDVATGHLLAAQVGQPGRRYILGGENHSFRSLLRSLARAAGQRPRAILPLPRWLAWIVAAMAEGRAVLTRREPYPSFGHVRINTHHWYADSSRAAIELGFECRPLYETLHDAFEWYRQHARGDLPQLARWWLRPAQAA